MSTFTLKINLGNEAMQTQADVAEALRHVAKGMTDDSTWDGSIIDRNGNNVGSFDADVPPPAPRYLARLMREGDEVESLDEVTPEQIADHFGLNSPRERGAVEQVCEWATEEGTAQGMATGAVDSLVIEEC